jgi:hypothetical protein
MAWVVSGQPARHHLDPGGRDQTRAAGANLRALDLVIPPALRARIDEVSRSEVARPYVFFGEPVQSMINGRRRRAAVAWVSERHLVRQ